LYTCPYRWEDDLLAENSDLNNKFFAFKGELIQNVTHTVGLGSAVFNLLNNMVMVLTQATIVAALIADANLQLMGPYQNGDANTEGVKTRKMSPVPHFIGGIWLFRPDGIMAQEFWILVYPIIVGQGKRPNVFP